MSSTWHSFHVKSFYACIQCLSSCHLLFLLMEAIKGPHTLSSVKLLLNDILHDTAYFFLGYCILSAVSLYFVVSFGLWVLARSSWFYRWSRSIFFSAHDVHIYTVCIKTIPMPIHHLVLFLVAEVLVFNKMLTNINVIFFTFKIHLKIAVCYIHDFRTIC